MTPEQSATLLASDEVETIERKTGFDHKEIRKALIAFANDQAERGQGWLILGQAPNKDIVGLMMGADEVQRKIADIAKDQCNPTIPISIEIIERDGKRLAIVEVRSSLTRPHFDGKAWVRVGSTTRPATEGEIIQLRAARSNKKVSQLRRWLNEGRTIVTLSDVKLHGRERVTLQDVTEHWVKLGFGTTSRGFPLDDLSLSYDYDNDRPEIVTA